MSLSVLTNFTRSNLKRDESLYKLLKPFIEKCNYSKLHEFLCILKKVRYMKSDMNYEQAVLDIMEIIKDKFIEDRMKCISWFSNKRPTKYKEYTVLPNFGYDVVDCLEYPLTAYYICNHKLQQLNHYDYATIDEHITDYELDRFILDDTTKHLAPYFVCHYVYDGDFEKLGKNIACGGIRVLASVNTMNVLMHRIGYIHVIQVDTSNKETSMKKEYGRKLHISNDFSLIAMKESYKHTVVARMKPYEGFEERHVDNVMRKFVRENDFTKACSFVLNLAGLTMPTVGGFVGNYKINLLDLDDNDMIDYSKIVMKYPNRLPKLKENVYCTLKNETDIVMKVYIPCIKFGSLFVELGEYAHMAHTIAQECGNHVHATELHVSIGELMHDNFSKDLFEYIQSSTSNMSTKLIRKPRNHGEEQGDYVLGLMP